MSILSLPGPGYSKASMWNLGLNTQGHDFRTKASIIVVRGSVEREDVELCWDEFSCSCWSCPTLCNPMYCSILGLCVHHQLPEFTQTHAHWVNAIQPSHPLPLPSPPAFSLSQHQGLFKWVSSSHQVAKILPRCVVICCFNWSIHKKNPVSHKYIVRKERYIFIAFQDNYEYPLILHQNLTSGSFL